MRYKSEFCPRALGVYLIQSNWTNSLNRPELTGLGGSLVISPTGDVLHQCSFDEPGISIVSVDLS